MELRQHRTIFVRCCLKLKVEWDIFEQADISCEVSACSVLLFAAFYLKWHLFKNLYISID